MSVRFDKERINDYFINGVIGYDQKSEPIKFSNEIVCDENQVFWKQNCIKYEKVDEIDVINNFKEYFEPYDRTHFIKSGIKNMVLEAYRQFGRDKYKSLKSIPEDCIVFKDKIVYVGSKDPRSIFDNTLIVDDINLEKGNNYIINNMSNYFITNPIPYDYTPDKEHNCPKIHQLIVDWVGEENSEMIYELVGYCMLPQYDIQKIWLLTGEGSNGKSKLMELIEKIIGNSNMTATDLTTLTETNFGVAQLYKKLVCYIGETDGHKLERTSVLKRLSGGDLVPAQFKNQPNFVFRNYAKIIIGTNTVPQTQDKTFGYYRRFIIIKFPKQFEPKDIWSDIPAEEFESFANICAKKVVNLLKNRRFTNEPSDKEKARIYEEESNPLLKYLANEIEITQNPTDTIFAYEFENSYIDWLGNNGYSKNISKTKIKEELESREVDYAKKTKYIETKNYDGTKISEPKQYYCYFGIKFKSKATLKKEDTATEDYTDREFDRQGIIEFLRKSNKFANDYEDDYMVKLAKKSGIIYEKENNVFKLDRAIPL